MKESSIRLQYESWAELARLKGGTLSDFSTSIVVKYRKIEEGEPLGKKNFPMPKKLKGGRDPKGFFNIYAVAKHQKN